MRPFAQDCFYLYDGADVSAYSTHFYRDKAVAAVAAHDFDRSPMFMYLAFQVRSWPAWKCLLHPAQTRQPASPMFMYLAFQVRLVARLEMTAPPHLDPVSSLLGPI